MGVASYLPSPQFSLVLSSVVIAGGLIWAADAYTSPATAPTVAPVQTSSAITSQGLDWKAALAAIQGENVLPEPPSEASVATLLAASETPNVTATLGRTVLVTLGEAKAQGLGSDIPTQERIVAEALAKVESSQKLNLYVAGDLTTAQDTPELVTAYGNGVATILTRHPEASYEAVLLAIGDIEGGGETKLAQTAAAYKTAARELSAMVVPQTLAPLHLQVVNNLARIGAACEDLTDVLSDPVKGLVALQNFQSLSEETGRLFINIAQAFDKNGILFSENEPGAAWNLLVGP